MKKFSSDYHIPTVSLLWVTVLILLATPFFAPANSLGEIIIQVLILSGAFMLLWVLFDTKYVINHSYLYYYSGPIRGKIDIFNINTIEQQKKWFVNASLKPALGNHGFIIRYNQFDDIYVSPRDKKRFVEALLDLNPQIEIK
mgnify:CR=1 FL=1